MSQHSAISSPIKKRPAGEDVCVNIPLQQGFFGHGGAAIFDERKGAIIMNLFGRTRRGFIAGAVVLMTCMGAVRILPVYGDHPEQTMQRKEREMSSVTLEDVTTFTNEYILRNSKDGLFTYYDKNAKKDLELILDNIHREKLSKTRKNEYFVCVNFTGRDGRTYDLDFFVQGKSKRYFTIDKKGISIHKVNGKECYVWVYHEKKDVWTKKIIETEEKQSAQPAYPKPDYP
ncbi:MAG: hypothetical protein E3K33_09975 [Candidatus Brocadia sp.]|nr:hypothetical protein [Candidatus Brocadia sp.]